MHEMNKNEQPPELKPCPFCGRSLNVRWRKINPKASCPTPGCWGGKLPVLQLDIPEFVAAWNVRPTADVVWHSADLGLPDAETTVLMAYEDDGDALVFMGYHDGEGWVDVTGLPVPGVTHWAELPDPPAF